jgi:2-amino-4-hydroxy-6-hydroxymethyldihydropteridine diphosphokinase
MSQTMIYIGLGGNIPTAAYGPPQHGLAAALGRLGALGVRTLQRSRWYRSAPVPVSAQPWFVNGVAAVATALAPGELLALLHQVEAEFGRVREHPWEPRSIDLDLLTYDDLIVNSASTPNSLQLPHPRLHERAFVLVPLAEIAPTWRHPVSGRAIAELIAALEPGQVVEPLEQ